VALCVASAVGFGTTGVFSVLADRAGVALTAMLALRFAVAAATLLPAVAAGAARAPSPRRALRPYVVGVCLTSVQTALLLVAITRVGASLAVLLHYAYPAIVALASVALRREPRTRRLAGVVALATAGVALVLAGGGIGEPDPVGAACGIGSAALYAAYILLFERLVGHIEPLPLAVLVLGGMTTAFLLAWGVQGLPLGFEARGWLWIVALGAVATAGPLVAFLGGIRLVGASTASTTSTAEPVTTVILAWIFLDESLAAAQLAGAALVVAALFVSARRPPPRPV
jgi:drug/metabolite transporter (DMT)-like permease